FSTYPSAERSSVWIQQEFAVFSYRMFLEQRSLPVRVYAERGIRREGVMEIAVANPIEFDHDDEVIIGIDEWLKSREFEEHPTQVRRKELFRSRVAQMDQDQLLLLELITAHCLEPDDSAELHVLREDFTSILRQYNVQDHEIGKKFDDAYNALRTA